MGKGKEYLKNKNKVLDMRKTFEEQKTILTDCYHWKDVYEALILEKEEVLEKIKKFALGLNGETHVDKAIRNCPCDACRIINLIIEEEKKNK